MMAMTAATAMFAGQASMAADGVRPQTCVQVAPDATPYNYRVVALMQQVPELHSMCVSDDVVPEFAEQAVQDSMDALRWYR